jgi:general secretion pathway protein K
MSKQGQKGFALLTVLGLLAVFFMAAQAWLSASQGLSDQALRQETRLNAYFLARQAMAQAQWELMAFKADKEMGPGRVDGSWRQIPSRRGLARVSVQDESGKLSLVRPSHETLKRALIGLGLSGPQLTRVHQQLLWLRQLPPASRGDTSSPHTPRHPGELAQTLGLDPALVFANLPQDRLWGLKAGQGLWSMLTLYTVGAKLNLNAAPPAVLYAVAGLEGERLERFLKSREQRPFDDLAQAEALLPTSAPPEANQGFTVTPGDTYTIMAQARPAGASPGGGVRRTLAAVVKLAQGKLPDTLYWVDDLPLP